MHFLNSLNDFLWSYILIILLLGLALYFTIRSRGVQFRMIKEMVRIMLGRDRSEEEKKASHLGSFQAFAISLASRVGTGNLAGVASAIFVGGPGAVFWMWITALLGAATAFVESTLAQLYKRKGSQGFYGGPAYYMETGLGKKWMGILFSVLIVLSFALANNIMQSNTIVDSLHSTLGFNKIITGVVLTLAAMSIIIGGVKRISKFMSYIVPVMALGYLLLAVGIAVFYADRIPAAFCEIFRGAFGLRQIGGGMMGAAIMQGVRRGLFSNEAGEGSAPNAAAVAVTSHPVKQGLVQALGVFIDTIVICSCTALIIIIGGQYTGGADGIVLTLSSLEALVGPAARYFVTFAVFLFAFSTLIANAYYGETNIRFITSKRGGIWVFWLVSALCIFFGAVGSLSTAWAIVDICMALLTLCNLVAIGLLSKQAFRLLEDYRKQKKSVKEPQFRKSSMPDIADKLEGWD